MATIKTGNTYSSTARRGKSNLYAYKYTYICFLRLVDRQCHEKWINSEFKFVSIALLFGAQSVITRLVGTLKTRKTLKTGEGDCLVCMYSTYKISAILTSTDNFLFFCYRFSAPAWLLIDRGYNARTHAAAELGICICTAVFPSPSRRSAARNVLRKSWSLFQNPSRKIAWKAP